MKPASKKLAYGAGGIAAAAALLLGTGSAAASGTHHYYVEVGGTGAAAASPQCTSTYYYPNQQLNGGIPVPVCYPASAGPLVGPQNQMPDPSALDYTDSVQQGAQNTLAAVEHAYHIDPSARFTIVGYSQGAQAADEALATIATGGTDVPGAQVDGMLYADPMQPVTGAWAVVPVGWNAFGFTSTGPGRTEFNGIPVQRFCIHTDMACDATTFNVVGFLEQHPKYHAQNGIMEQTLAHDGSDGITWYNPT